MTRCSVLILFFLQSSLAYLQDSFSGNLDRYTFFPDENVDENLGTFENEKKSNHFLRFGRNQDKYRSEYAYFNDFPIPTGTTKREKNDHFARFGRNQQFLRFGRNNENFLNDNDMYPRMGRSIPDADIQKARGKREAAEQLPPKQDAYMRYAKNAHFVRFGRNQRVNSIIIPGVNKDIGHFSKDEGHKYQNFKISQLLEELKRRQKGAFVF